MILSSTKSMANDANQLLQFIQAFINTEQLRLVGLTVFFFVDYTCENVMCRKEQKQPTLIYFSEYLTFFSTRIFS